MSLKLYPKKKKTSIILKLSDYELAWLIKLNNKNCHFGKLLFDEVSQHPKEFQNKAFDRAVHAINCLAIKGLVARIDLVKKNKISDCVLTSKGIECLEKGLVESSS